MIGFDPGRRERTVIRQTVSMKEILLLKNVHDTWTQDRILGVLECGIPETGWLMLDVERDDEGRGTFHWIVDWFVDERRMRAKGTADSEEGAYEALLKALS